MCSRKSVSVSFVNKKADDFVLFGLFAYFFLLRNCVRCVELQNVSRCFAEDASIQVNELSIFFQSQGQTIALTHL